MPRLFLWFFVCFYPQYSHVKFQFKKFSKNKRQKVSTTFNLLPESTLDVKDPSTSFAQNNEHLQKKKKKHLSL